MKFYTVDLNKKDLYDQFKHSDTYFKWLKLPDYFKTSEFKVYFTTFGLNNFISYDFENMQNNLGYTKDNFDIKEISIEVKDRRVVHRIDTCIIFRTANKLG